MSSSIPTPPSTSLNTTPEIDCNVRLDSKKIKEMLVRDLRNELEKRQLDKTGTKAVLIDRLVKVTNLLITCF